MAIEAVILDLSGTLVDGQGRALLGAADLLSNLQESGIQVAVAATHDTAFGILKSAGLVPDLVLTRRTVGANKGSSLWVSRATAAFGVQPHQVVWLGDSQQDMLSALNADVIYFNAGWSAPDYRYGIQVESPRLFAALITGVFAKTHNWYWTCEGADAAGRRVRVRSVVDANGAGDGRLARQLRSLLKEGTDSQLGPITLGDFARYHLLASIYAEGLVGGPDVIWATYPGSGGNENPFLTSFAHLASQLFRDRFVGNLLVRHTPATDMSHARTAHQEVNFLDQINTVCLNADHQGRVRGNRVVVVDDFTTEGYSFECARNLLLLAGAAEVVSVCVGRYGAWYGKVAPVDGYTWDPFRPCIHDAANFQTTPCGRGATVEHNALDVFLRSYRELAAYTPF